MAGFGIGVLNHVIMIPSLLKLLNYEIIEINRIEDHYILT